MTWFFDNGNGSTFAGFPWPKSSLLRHTVPQLFLRDSTIRVTQTTSRTQGTGFLFTCPLVVTSGSTQATMAARRNSMTSLNSQGRVVNV